MKFRMLFLAMFVFLVFLAGRASAIGNVFRLSDEKIISFDEMIDDLERTDIVFLGEDHDNERHHKDQLEIISSLNKKGVPISLGLEMFQAEDQKKLDGWVGGRLDSESFIKFYYASWRLPWPLYAGIFTYAKDYRIPMIGLNVPFEITQKVAREGFQSLTGKEIGKLPRVTSCNIDERYMDYVKRAFEAHDTKGRAFVNFCEAQMVWDKSMSMYIIEYLKKNPGRVMVVLSGEGHSWKYGIPEQIKISSNYRFKVILHEAQGKLTRESATIKEADYLILGS